MALPSSLLKYEEPQQLQDIMQMQALQRAQQLKTQQDEIATQQKQQAFDRQNQVREDIQSRFSDGGDEDLDNALGIIQASALEAGDYETALSVEKSRRIRKGDTPQPLTPQQRQLLSPLVGDIPEGATTKDLDLYGSLLGKKAYTLQVGDNIDKRQDMLQSLAPGGYQSDVDPVTGQGPTKKDGDTFTKAVAAHTKIQNYLNQLEASLGSGRGNDPTDPEFVNQRQLIAAMQVAFKEKNNFGAALTANEQLINDAQLPVILARSDVGVGRALVEAGLGRTPQDAIRYLRETLRQELDGQAPIYKFKKYMQAQRNPDDLANSLVQQSSASDDAAFQAHKQAHLQKLRAGRQ